MAVNALCISSDVHEGYVPYQERVVSANRLFCGVRRQGVLACIKIFM